MNYQFEGKVTDENGVVIHEVLFTVSEKNLEGDFIERWAVVGTDILKQIKKKI